MPAPRKGFNLYRPDLLPDNGVDTDVYTNILSMAEMHCDTVKVAVEWGGHQYHAFPDGYPGLRPLQGPWGGVEPSSIHGAYSFNHPDHEDRENPAAFDQIGFIRSLVAEVQQADPESGLPDPKVVITFRQCPPDVDGAVDGGRFPDSVLGWDQFGFAAAQVVNALGDTFEAIEIDNEPNLKRSVPGGTEIPPVPYAGMAAYVLYWIYHCCGGLGSDGLLKKKVLLGSLAASSTKPGNWTSGLSPTQWIQQMSSHLYNILGTLTGMTPTLRDQLFNSWRLSIHPYPDRGRKDDEGRPPADRNNREGDYTAGMAITTVWDLYDQFQGLFPNRKLWITETGVSSGKLGENGQKDFFQALCYRTKLRYDSSDTRLEGIIAWGFSDCDPGMHNQDDGYYEFGVIRKSNGTSRKLAGDNLRYFFKEILI